jgi:hypothetical protein
MRQCEKTRYTQTGHRSQYKTSFAYWITKATKTNTLTICNTYCFSTATMVSRMRLNVKLYVHFLSYINHYFMLNTLKRSFRLSQRVTLHFGFEIFKDDRP